jgi:hypothetical protein
MTQDELLKGETLILSKPANAIIRPDEYGLTRFVGDKYMWVAGMQGLEGIGGKLHLTNYRLIFVAHAINRLTGKFTIFLPTVQGLKDNSGFFSKQLEVNTATQKYTFVVWGVPALITAIQTNRDKIDARQKKSIQRIAKANFEKVGGGLGVNNLIEGLNIGLLVYKQVHEILEKANGPLDVSNILNLIELLQGDAE